MAVVLAVKPEHQFMERASIQRAHLPVGRGIEHITIDAQVLPLAIAATVWKHFAAAPTLVCGRLAHKIVLTGSAWALIKSRPKWTIRPTTPRYQIRASRRRVSPV